MTKTFKTLPGSFTNSRQKQPCKTRRVLGIDPGLASTGFGIVDYQNNRYKIICYGSIETKANELHAQRLLVIYNRLLALIKEFKPTEGSIETLYFAKNVSSAMGVAEARGVISLCLIQNNIIFGEYTPNQVKQAVSGSISADKKIVQNAIKLLLGLTNVPKPDHAADALAIAITHLHSSILRL
ncbi:MAG TPA: crossover junction endodeoxyribonuclease RuvC [Treponemataceae bacterium]|nr:crossover junction endodeoxyribonuclease RuvC [Treponemataceae bacterium]